VTLETPALSEPYEVRCFLYVYYRNPYVRKGRLEVVIKRE